MEKFSYLLILLFTVSFPLVRSYEPRIHYFQYWKAVFKAIVPVAVIFILADMLFTHMGVWWFNPDRVLGIYFFNLPLEECLFFIAVPFSCIFIYEALNYFFPNPWQGPLVFRVLQVLIVLLVVVGVWYYDRWYTSVYCLSTAAFIAYHTFVLRSPYIGNFLRCYAVCLIPFFVVNGLLTALPVVLYNPHEFTGIRMYTIPAEDVVYGMFLILAVVTIYEKLRRQGSGDRDQ